MDIPIPEVVHTVNALSAQYESSGVKIEEAAFKKVVNDLVSRLEGCNSEDMQKFHDLVDDKSSWSLHPPV